MNHLLEVQHLSAYLGSESGRKDIIHDVNLHLARNEVLVLLGESGSGKTVLSRTLTRLLSPASTLQVEGSVMFEGENLVALDEAGLARFRREKIRYIFQEPAQALNPVTRIRTQMSFARTDNAGDDDTLIEVLGRVGLAQGAEILDLYPYQLSIGMAQRVLIAMAILPQPSLLIADEPTSAVDVSLRFQLVELLQSIQHTEKMSMIFITHDLDIARFFGDRIVVLYRGRVVESGPRDAFFNAPLHPYSRLLIESRPTPGKPLSASLGPPAPDHDQSETGCRFQTRCPIAKEQCRQSEPALERTEEGKEVRCFYWK